MSPRYMLSVLFSHVRRGKVISLVAFLITLLVSFRVLANDNPYNSSEVCVRVAQSAVMIDGKTFAKININKDKVAEDPRACSLRTAYAAFPILDQSGKQLGMQAWLRSVYAANQGSHPTVLRGCVPTVNHKPPADATDEEKAFCPQGVVNIYGVPSNHWTAWILIPRQPQSTWAEAQAAAAKVACAEAKSPEAKKACQDAGHQPPTASAQTPAPAVTDEATKFSKELEVKLVELKQKLSDAEKALGETKEQLAVAEAGWSNSYLWIIIGALTMALAIVIIKVRSLRKKLQAQQTRNTMPTRDALIRENASLKRQLRLVKGQGRVQAVVVDDSLERDLMREEHEAAKTRWQAELAEAKRQKDEASTQNVAELSRVQSEFSRVDGELNRLRQDFASRLDEETEKRLTALRGIHTESVNDNIELHRQNDELRVAVADQSALTARNRELASQVAERDTTISALKSQIDTLNEQLRVANDNAQAGVTQTSTVTNPPASTVTSPQTKRFPFVVLSEQEEQQLALVRQRSDAFETMMPTLIAKLGGDPAILTKNPDSIMFYVVLWAEGQSVKLNELTIELESVKSARDRVEARVIELDVVRRQLVQTQFLYMMAEGALQKAIGSDCAGRGGGSDPPAESVTPSASQALARLTDHNIGSPRVPEGIVPPGAIDDPGEITIEGGSQIWFPPESRTEPDHSGVVSMPEAPHTPTIPIASNLPRKGNAGQG